MSQNTPRQQLKVDNIIGTLDPNKVKCSDCGCYFTLTPLEKKWALKARRLVFDVHVIPFRCLECSAIFDNAMRDRHMKASKKERWYS